MRFEQILSEKQEGYFAIEFYESDRGLEYIEIVQGVKMDELISIIMKDVKDLQIYDILHRNEGYYIENIVRRYVKSTFLFKISPTFENWYLMLIFYLRIVKIIQLKG